MAGLLAAYGGRSDVIVLGLARGGVPVAAEVAAGLGVPLDVLVVRKLGTPGQVELAMGAIASGGVRVLNDTVIAGMGVDPADIERVTAAERAELGRRTALYRGDRVPLDVSGRVVVVVDDGLATGSTMRAAVAALRRMGPSRIVVAVPVGAPVTCAEFRLVADEVVCARQPREFHAVGEWYRDFRPTTDDEIRDVLGLTGPPPPTGIGGVDLIGNYERALTATSKVVVGVRDDQLAAPTPCAGWDVRTVGNHLIGRMWLVSRTVGDPPDYMARDRDAAFESAAGASLAIFRLPGKPDPTKDLAFALLETVVHGWDLAKSTGQNPAIEADVAGATFEVAKAVVTDELRAGGEFGPAVEVGDDAPVHERLVAFLGRNP
ncbi:MAG: TIGR03086 family metal-binding protein [Acidimicrobiales bacterium]